MVTFKKILCPVDFSDTSTRALRYASAFAAWYDADLTVLHVLPALEAPYSAIGSSGVPLPNSPSDAANALDHFLQQAGVTSLKADRVIREGRAAEVIVKSAEWTHADLLVMGTHGLGGFSHLLLGSVTEKVIRTATCPVLTVPPSASPEPAPPVELKKVLCAMDYSPSSLKALEYALDLGRQAGGRVIVMHAIEYMEPEEPRGPSPFDPHFASADESHRRRQAFVDEAREQLHGLLAAESRTWCEIDEVIDVGRGYRAILSRASAAGADLIVMGAQGSRGLELMLYGSNTHHVVRAATCPVLTVRA